MTQSMNILLEWKAGLLFRKKSREFPLTVCTILSESTEVDKREMKKIISIIIVVFILLSAVSSNVVAAGNSAEEMYNEGMDFFEQGDYDRAFARFQISGEVRGYAPSQNMLGVCYRDGLGTEQDIIEAERCFRLSADQGYAAAQENLTTLEDARKEESKAATYPNLTEETILLDNERLSVSYTKEALSVTLKGLEIEDQYTTNKDNVQLSILEYGWMVDFTDYAHKYEVSTTSWAFSPGLNQAKPIDHMQHSLWMDGRNTSSQVKMEHTDKSITWTVDLTALKIPIDFPRIREFGVRIDDEEKNYYLNETYPVEAAEDFPTDGEFEYIELHDGNVQIVQYVGTQGMVKIPDKLSGKTVTTINEKAFSGKDNLISVEIPGSIEEIPSGAFMQCSNLQTVTIMEGVRSIGVVAFWECKQLKSITIPASVITIGWDNASVFPFDTSHLHAFVKQGSFAEGYCKTNNIGYSYY